MLKNYFKLAWKVLLRNKFYTFVSLFGISLTLAILLVVVTIYDHFLYPGTPEVNRERSLFLHRVYNGNENGDFAMVDRGNLYFMERYVKEMETPAKIAIASRNFPTITFSGHQQLTLKQMYTCEEFWSVHDFTFLEGHGYTRQDIVDNRYVAVISEATRNQYFGKEVAALGQWIEVDKVRYQVVGVVANVPSYQFVTYSDLYVPYSLSLEDPQAYGFVGDYVAILVADQAGDLPRIKTELNDVVAGIDIPKNNELQILKATAEPYIGLLAKELFRGKAADITRLRYFIFGGIFLFMLLPALNLSNLNGSRIMERAPEIGVRKAFGATTDTLTVQFLVENTLLSLLGGLIGFGVAWILMRVIESSGWLPYADLRIHPGLWLTGIGLTLLFAFLSGVLPARRMSRMPIVHAINENL